MTKEKVVVFDDGSIESQYLELAERDNYEFTKIKVKAFQAGKLKDWLDQVKGGTAENKTKVFLAFNNEFTNANEIKKELIKLEETYPTLSISSMLDGMDSDSIKKRLGLPTKAEEIRAIKNKVIAGELTQEQADKLLNKELSKDEIQAQKEGSTVMAKESAKPISTEDLVKED
ncbi:MAG TPA: hypothetical protein VF220_01425 [Nitrososphaeraceae archaeon]